MASVEDCEQTEEPVNSSPALTPNNGLRSQSDRSLIGAHSNSSLRTWSRTARSLPTNPSSSISKSDHDYHQNQPRFKSSVDHELTPTDESVQGQTAITDQPQPVDNVNSSDPIHFASDMDKPSMSSSPQSETIELENLDETNTCHEQESSFYFEDAIRRIDFVLVYSKDMSPSALARDQNSNPFRKQFESNLRDEGLELEYAKGGRQSDLRFVKIHAPWTVLVRYAEIMKLKMVMKQIETSWRLVFDEDDPYSKGKFTAPFTRDKLYIFDIPAQKERFFSSSQRSQIVDFILKRKNFANSKSNDASSFGMNKLLQEGVYLASYPLHEGRLHESSSSIFSARSQLLQNWASISRMYSKQPLDEIRKYFGVKIALYFAWLGFYTSMLIPASIVGVLCFCYGWFTLQYDNVTKEICDKSASNYLNKLPMCPLCSIKCPFWSMADSCAYAKLSYLFDNPATVAFAVFMSLWATVYLEMWKRYSARITYRWDLSNFDKFEEYPRPEYLAKLSRGEKKKLNVITKMYEPYVPFWRKQLPYTVLSGSVVFFLVFVALATVLGVIVYRVALRTILSKSNDEQIVDYSMLITSSTAAMINLMCILLFNALYSKVAYYLTELEMPRTQTDFDNSLTLKMYLLQFVNYYSSIFYIAFFKGRFVNHPGELTDNGSFAGRTQEECGTGGCLVELAIQLAIIMVGKQALNAAVEMSTPWFEWCVHRWRMRSKVDVTNDHARSTSGPKQWEEDFVLAHWGAQALFYEYLEMVLQFGFVTIFVAAFPLAPLFALINNALEIRLDAKKMISSFRRPVAQRVKNIGIWYRILDSIGKLSVLTNAVIIAFTSDFIPRILFYAQNGGTMSGYLNSTLSTFNVSALLPIYHNRTEIEEMVASGITECYYQGNRNSADHPSRPLQPNYEYWELLAMKLFFVFAFENIIATITMLLRWLIPDVPRTLKQHIRQHAYLTNELIMQQELKRAKELGLQAKSFG